MTNYTLNVGNLAQLNSAMQQADADTTSGDTYTVTFTQSFTETVDPTAINLHSGVSVTIDGNGEGLLTACASCVLPRARCRRRS